MNNVIRGVEEHTRFDRNFENTPLLDLLAKGHLLLECKRQTRMDNIEVFE